jgi:hypothetical protein
VPSKRGKKRRTGERNNIADMRYDCIGWVALCEETFPLPPRMASLLVVVEATLQDADSNSGRIQVLVILQVSTNGIGSISQSMMLIVLGQSSV